LGEEADIGMVIFRYLRLSIALLFIVLAFI